MILFAQDIIPFYGTMYAGLIIGFLFDFNRVIKKNFNVLRYFKFIFDTIFWILVTIISFMVINKLDSFDLRYYHFIALFIGFLVYLNTVSKFIFKILDFFISTIKNIILALFKYIFKFSQALYYVVIYNIHFFVDFIFLISRVLFIKRKRKGIRRTKKRV